MLFFTLFSLVSYFGFAFKVCGRRTSVPFPGHRVPVAMTANASIAPGICATVGLVKMQLQSGGQKGAGTCSLHCLGLMLKLLAQIPVPQVFNPWPRAKEKPVTKSKRRNSVTACCSPASEDGGGLQQQG